MVDSYILYYRLLAVDLTGSLLMAEGLTRDRGAAGLSLTGVTANVVLEQDTFILA